MNIQRDGVICAQRKEGVIYLYIDGKLYATNSTSNAAASINNSTAPLTIGSDSNTGSEKFSMELFLTLDL